MRGRQFEHHCAARVLRCGVAKRGLCTSCTAFRSAIAPRAWPALVWRTAKCAGAHSKMLTAKLIGEGYAKPNADSELPIDINYAKVNEWLVRARSPQVGPRFRPACFAWAVLERVTVSCAISGSGARALAAPSNWLLLAAAAAAAAQAAGLTILLCFLLSPPAEPASLLPCMPALSGEQVDRNQVPADWNRKLAAIQAKAAEALAELPPGFMGQFEGAWGLRVGWFRSHWSLPWVLGAVGAGFGFPGAPHCPLTSAHPAPSPHAPQAARTLPSTTLRRSKCFPS